MDQQIQQVVGYIKQCQSQAIATETIITNLQNIGWPLEIINQALVASGLKPPAEPAAPATSPATSHLDIAPVLDKPKMWSAEPPALEKVTGETAVPEDYWLVRAINDSIKAIGRNPLGFGLSIIISVVVLAGSFMLVSSILGSVVFSQSAILTASVANLIAGMLIILFAYTLCYSFAGAFFITTSSLAIYDGRQRRRTDVRIFMRESLERTAPVVRATAAYAFVIFWPMMLLVALPLIVLIGGRNGFLVVLMFLIMIGSLGVTITGLFRYSLAPYIAVFEPEVPLLDLLQRSRFLIGKGGYWFLGKGLIVLTVFSVVIFSIVNFALGSLSTGPLWALTVAVLLDSILINSVMVMFYLNRRALGGNAAK